MSVAKPFEQTLITHTQGLFLIILLSSIEEEDLQRFTLNLLCLNCLWLIFR